MSGRSVLVTGGTGALGRAVADAFLEAGARVTVPWIVAAEAEAARGAWQGRLAAGQAVLVEADVAEESGARRAAAAAGEVDVLVNGVGGFAGGAPFDETPSRSGTACTA